MSPEVWVALGSLAVAVVLGLVWRARQGRIRRAAGSPPSGAVLPKAVLAAVGPHDGVTLLMLSAPVCARCPQARAMLAALAAGTPALRFAELDLGAHPELAAELGVRSTPVTLAVSRTGRELFRVIGVPRRTELLDALTPHLSAAPR